MLKLINIDSTNAETNATTIKVKAMNNQSITNEDQALIDDLFSQFDEISLDEIDLTDQTEPTVEAAEPTVEAAAVIEPTVEAVEPTVEAAVIESTEQQLAEIDFDLDLDLSEELAAPTAVEATNVEKPTSEKKIKPKASAGGNRVTFYNSSKSTVLLDRLGGNTDLIILEASDLDLSKEELQAKRQYLLNVMNYQPMTVNDKGDPVKSDGLNGETVQKKVAEKVIQLFTYLNKGGNLNKVMRISFELLLKDGYLTFGKQGNLYAALLANEYSDGTARAQSGQIQKLFPLLKIALPSGKGSLEPNSTSIILAKMNAELNLQQPA